MTADEQDIDYMSDTMLEKLAANERPLELTYSQRQTKRRIDEAEPVSYTHLTLPTTPPV